MIISDDIVKKEIENPVEMVQVTKKQKMKVPRLKRVKGKSILSFVPFRRIISEDCFAMTEGVSDYLEIEQLYVRSGSKTDRSTAIEEFWEFIRVMTCDIKIITTNNPADMTENIDYAKRRFALTTDIDTPYVKAEKNYAFRQLDVLNNNRMTEEVYIQIFADSEEELQEISRLVLGTSGIYFRVKRIKMEKKVTLIHSLNNMGDSRLVGIPYTGNDKEGRPEHIQKIVDKKGYDPLFISQIQPMGNINTKDSEYIRTNTGYLKTLHITDYKKKNNPAFYGEKVFKFPNTTTSIDIFNVDKEHSDFERSLNRSLGEYEDRIETSKDKISRKKARNEYIDLDKTIDTIIDDDEVLKQIHVRIYLHAENLEELRTKESEVKTKLKKSGFHANCFLDEAEVEYRALFVSYSENQKQRKRKGQEIKGLSFAGSYFFNSAKLIDPTALYCGYTLYGNGLVLINQFHKDRSRKSYGGFYIGGQGFGKSTEIKATAKSNRLLGNNTFMFMVSDESETLVKKLGGRHFNAREPRINPAQIYATDVDVKTSQTKEKQSYVTNLTKMKVIMGMAAGLSPVATKSSQKYLTQFYNEWLDKKNLDITKITQYDPEQYALYSDFQHRMKGYYDSEPDHTRKEVMTEIIDGLEVMLDTYGDIFNSYTEFSLENEKLVAFNLESLLNLNDINIYNAQYFNLYNMVYSHAVKIGQREKHLYITKKKTAKELIYTDIVSDEFHNPIRSENLELLNQMDRNNREGRKIFIGQHYAVHAIEDCFVDTGETGPMGPISKVVMNLFKLSTYRYIFNQDTSSLPKLKTVFGNEISESDIKAITRLEEGQVHLNIKGTTNIKFKRELSKKDEQIFEGSI